ncbi:MarR family winged helix-turn-helix transcriptional regulator [Palleronia sp. KMU-117]|uniref:MarR family winged helix-turn-helix transcriptional regulator n=1 Tax=Palleronia sp. KMU-117 TaxID=3434108 RepID=UPI003D734DE2
MTRFVLEGFLPYQLAVAAERVSREFARTHQKRFGISIPEWRVLAYLSRVDAVSVREIHARVEMDKSKISRAASRLEAAGYVSKQVNNGDRRLVELSLTEAGRALVDKVLPEAMTYEARVMDELGDHGEAFRAALAVLTTLR